MKKQILISITLFFVVMLLDRMTKIWVSGMALNEAKHIAWNFINITYVHNYGGAFSIFMNQRWLFITMGILVPVLLCFLLKNYILANAQFLFSCSLIIAGAIGNLIDRIAFGYVIDFIQIGPWPVFNIADIAITGGIIWLSILLIGEEQKNRGGKHA